MAAKPNGKLRFLYQGSRGIDDDLRFYRDTLGMRVLWDKRAFGARVAALDDGCGVLLLLADHRPPGSVLPVYEVADLAAAVRDLRRGGFAPDGEPFEIPNGPCRLLRDASGTHVALFEDVRPDPFGT